MSTRRVRLSMSPLLPGGALFSRLSLVSHRLYRTTGTMLFTYSVEGAPLGGV